MTAEEFIAENEKNFFRTRKKDYEISVSMSDRDQSFHNDLEDVDYAVHPGDVILTGTVGEKWCTGLDKVLSTYTLPNGSKLTKDILEAKRGRNIKVRTAAGGKECFACRVPADVSFKINTRWAQLTVNRPGIDHGKGDFLVCNATPDGKPDLSHPWSVNGKVFENTYRMPKTHDKIMGKGRDVCR